MKTYRRHSCTRTHRTYRTMAQCIWPRAVWIIGNGEFASVAWCRALTIQLHHTLEAAEEAKAAIDSTGCGGACRGDHEIVRLAL